MSEAARVLRFPIRWQIPLSPTKVAEVAQAFVVGDQAEEAEAKLSNPDILSSVCKLLRGAVNSDPSLVAKRASTIYEFLKSSEGECGLFDERDYFLGETALLAGTGFRLLGDREQAGAWSERAEAWFRHTVNPGPVLAQVAFLRLSLAYDKRRYNDVLDLLPSLLKSFERFQMRTETAKTRFLEGMTLKECSRQEDAFERFTGLAETVSEADDPGLLGQVFVEIGAFHSLKSRFADAMTGYQKAMPLLARAGRLYAVAHLKMTIGETLRAQGALASAAEAFREGIDVYAKLEMATWVAYSRVILAELLIALDRHREAEWEILAALPTIEEQKMVPEGFAAVALLRESVRRRQADPNALRQLREHLKANS